MKITKQNIIKYVIIGFVIALIVFTIKKPYESEGNKELFQGLSDCSLIPGILLIGLYLLAWLSNDGMFDGIGYAGKFAISMIIPNHKVYSAKDGYYKYKQEKAEKRSKSINKDALFVGLGYLIIAIIFYVIYLLV